jgi:hypothetical protein
MRDRIRGPWEHRDAREQRRIDRLFRPESGHTSPLVIRIGRSPHEPEFELPSLHQPCCSNCATADVRLSRFLADYFRYYHRRRTHQSLEMDSPEGRQTDPVDRGRVVEINEVGGLHHHYVRVAA